MIPEWVLFERTQMHEAVNKERRRFHKESIDVKTIIRAENCAKGHSDYQSKLVLYCTELVFDSFVGCGL
jgi:hypothetical protein